MKIMKANILLACALFLGSQFSFCPPGTDAPETTKAQSNNIQFTFAMIKPDAVRMKQCGRIIGMIEDNGFAIVTMHMIKFSEQGAKTFYEEHKDRPFFAGLIDFITSGPIIVLVLAKVNAVKDWRTLMGATDSTKAGIGTIRKLFGTNIQINAIHGSDSPESALREIGLFFPQLGK